MTTAKSGLTEEEVSVSRKAYGTNLLLQKKKRSFARQYVACFSDPIIRILLVALFTNIVFLFKDFNIFETIGIAAAVFIATIVSTISEYSSEAAFEKLQSDADNILCRVRRSGHVIEVPIGDIVVGDRVLLQFGDKVPADGIVAEGSFAVDQSALNGESKEAKKQADGIGEGFLCAGKVFRGSVVTSGEGEIQIISVGEQTFYGKLAVEIQEEKGESPLKQRLRALAKTISIFGYLSAFFVVIALTFNNIFIDNQFSAKLISAYFANPHLWLGDLLRSVTLGITVIVMAVPEGLPMMITVVLSQNMKRMMKDQVLVRKMVGIETSGSLNILFSDKTGTLTKGKLEVVQFLSALGEEVPAKDLSKHSVLELVLESCYYNNGASVSIQSGKKTAVGGNFTDRALLQFCFPYLQQIAHRVKTNSIPFSSESKYSCCDVSGERKTKQLIKGAPEVLLDTCTHVYTLQGTRIPLVNTALLKNALKTQAQAGARLLALCIKEEFTTLLGFVCIKDEVRPKAKQAIAEVLGAGVQVVMMTGDNRDTAVSIARQVGLLTEEKPGSVLTSSELAALTDAQLTKMLPSLRVIARALPADKSRLVRVSQSAGLVVGMTGDGVNDAPALKKADVGFAMGSGTEVAKEAGDIVILDNNFTSISKAILYGRTIFKSIRKFIVYQMSMNLCAVGISILGPLFFGIDTPITVVQMLWINIIMDTLAGLAYAGEAPRPEYMLEKPKRREEKIISKSMWQQMFFAGGYILAICLLFLKLPIFKKMFVTEAVFLTAFFALFIFCGVFNSFNARTHHANVLTNLQYNKSFAGIFAFIACVQVCILYFGGNIFRTAGIHIPGLLLVILLACTVIVAESTRKKFFLAKELYEN